MESVENFVKVDVDGHYNHTDTSVQLASGHGAKTTDLLPYRLVWWDATTYADPADDPLVEIILVTAQTGDTLDTIVRGQEGRPATPKNTPGSQYKMIQSITKEMWTSLRPRTQGFSGLTLMSHPNPAAAPHTVFLAHADEITMDDGEAVMDWRNLSATLTANGLGGLDAGVEVSSHWYEVWAVWNGSQKGLVLKSMHQVSPAHFVAASDTTLQGIRSNADNSTVMVAQGFQAASLRYPFHDVKLAKVGTPTGSLWFTIETGTGSPSRPSGNVLYTSYQYDVARLSTTVTSVRIVFPNAVTLNGGDTYHLVAQGNWAISATNYVGWRMVTGGGDYGGGSKALFDSDTGTWTVVGTDDMNMTSYVETAVNPLVLPSGYRKSAHIGYAYNNSSGNLVPFLQRDRAWRRSDLLTHGLIVNEMTNAPTLIDLRAVVPALPSVESIVSLTGTGAAAAIAVFGDWRATDVFISGITSGQQVASRVSQTDEAPTNPVALITPYLCLMANGTAGADLYHNGFNW